ncbi:lipopolysaccharide transport periplasmic protein LptA [Arsenophonus symbiont of Ornithomya chloropus]|uniref:lipopolysaccharide transport periplasmic protein LptA n=1 Tax=Arsenophonus symbiont of Ornithomya chloropus TaxID=634121 RepID=UPI0032B194E3
MSIILTFSLSAIALKNDSKQAIHINSVRQSLNLEKNITIFTKNITIKQGSIDIRANKVIVTQANNTKKIILEAYGTPVTFYQMQEHGKAIQGHSDSILYEMEKERIILTGNAYLEQSDSNIRGDKITYLIKTQQMEAFSNTGKKVTSILLPAQLQKKNFIIKNKNNIN